MGIRIVEMHAHHVRIALKRPFRHASHSRTSTDNLVVSCRLEDGSTGYGEGVPREYVTGETIDSALDLVARADLNAQLSPCQDFAGSVAAAEAIRLPPVPGDDRGCQGNAARCAVELAVLDAYGQRFGQPLSEVIRLLAPDLWLPRPRVQYSGAVTTGSTGWKIRAVAAGMRLYGFRHLKVKVGVTGHDDVRRLELIRRRAGPKMELRIDANEAWAPDLAAQRILDLKPFGLSAVEQPVAHEHAARLPEVRRQTGVPIMLDESLCGAIDAERAVARGLCDIFNIRLSKCGGIIPSLRLVQFANRHGLGCQLGCQVGETAVLSAAGRHFAANVKNLRWVEGSYDGHLVREALARQNLTFGWGGWAPALTRPGLGIDIESGALQRVTLRSVRVL